jgi:hypothetical protein
MPTRCPKCGAEVEDGWPVCRKCFEPVKRPGFFARLLRSFGARVNVSVSKSSDMVPGMTTHLLNFKINERIKIRDGKTGEVREYHSLDEVPKEFRKTIREAQAMMGGQTSTKITFKDASGTVHNYNSLEEMPPDVRVIYDKVRGETGFKG